MKLLIKQRVFSWTDSYDVYDENEEAAYFVKAEFFTLGHQIHVYDSQNREVGSIHQRILTLVPAFDIVINGEVMGTIEKRFTLFKPKYDVDFCGWYVEGDFWGWDYNVYDGGSQIISISKELLHWGDTYILDFARPEDELMGLLLVIAIDAANCGD